MCIYWIFRTTFYNWRRFDLDKVWMPSSISLTSNLHNYQQVESYSLNSRKCNICKVWGNQLCFFCAWLCYWGSRSKSDFTGYKCRCSVKNQVILHSSWETVSFTAQEKLKITKEALIIYCSPGLGTHHGNKASRNLSLHRKKTTRYNLGICLYKDCIGYSTSLSKHGTTHSQKNYNPCKTDTCRYYKSSPCSWLSPKNRDPHKPINGAGHMKSIYSWRTWSRHN